MDKDTFDGSFVFLAITIFPIFVLFKLFHYVHTSSRPLRFFK